MTQVLVDFQVSGDSEEHQAATARVRQALSFNRASLEAKVQRLNEYLEGLGQLANKFRVMLYRCYTRRRRVEEAVAVVNERLNQEMLHAKLKVLQTIAVLEGMLFDLQDEACRASIFVIKDKEQDVLATLDVLASGGSVNLGPAFFMSPRDICATNPEMLRLEADRADLETRLKEAKARFTLISKQVVREELQSREGRVAGVLDRFRDSGQLGQHLPARSCETEFARLVLDVRCREGKVMAKWFGLVEARCHGGQVVAHSEIQTFLEKFVSSFKESYSVSAEQIPALRVLFQRLCFARLWRSLTWRDIETFKPLQIRFEQQLKWMRNLTQEQLGLSENFCAPLNKGMPYQESIQVMNDLGDLTAPGDMLACLLAVSQSLYRSARSYANSELVEIGADVFFPIWLFIIVHSHLPHVHTTLTLMQSYSMEKQTSETGYYLTCFESAIQHIMQCTENKY